MPNSYYVYVLCDPRKSGNHTYGGLSFTSEPFYAGKGKGRRAQQHISYVRNNYVAGMNENQYKSRKISKILKAGLTPGIVLLFTGFTEEEALSKEEEVISTIGRINLGTGPLTNLTDGGDTGWSGNHHSEETKKRMSEHRKGATKKPFTSDHRENLSSSQKGVSKKRSDEGESIRLDAYHTNLKKFGSKWHRRWEIGYPDGHKEVVLRLKDWCKEHQVLYYGMRFVALGTKPTYQGYSCTPLPKLEPPTIREITQVVEASPTLEEAAKKLNVSRDTVRRWIKGLGISSKIPRRGWPKGKPRKPSAANL